MPPGFLLRFFRWFCNPDYVEDIEGDLQEIFQRVAINKGEKKARWLFIFHVLKLFRPTIIRSFIKIEIKSTRYAMFKNYLFTAFRNMKREKLFAIMNITGLAIGIGCGLVIYKIITYELSFDSYHKNYSQLYRVIARYQHPQYGTVYNEGQIHPLAEAFRNDFAGIEATNTFYAKEGQVSVTDEKGDPERFHEYSGIAYAEPQFFKMFDFDFIAGDPSKALINRGSAVITSSLAQKYFKLRPNEVSQAMGKSMVVNNSVNFLVTGVIEDTKPNSDIPFTFIGDYQSQAASNPYFREGTDWGEYNSDTNTWIQLPDGMTSETLDPQLPAFMLKYSGKERASFASYVLQPLKELHSDQRVANYNKRQVSSSMLSILAVVGLFLVISACINFINMSTAQAIKRAKEIGVRKSLGVKRTQLINQFLGETIFISFLSSIVGLMIAQLLFMMLENILGYQLNVEVFRNIDELLFLVGLVISIGLLSGFYPAMVMAGMNPIKALKNNMSSKSAAGLLSLRRSLVVLQFVISQVLIISTIVAARQMDFFLGGDVGFDKEAIITTKVPGSSFEKLDALKKIMLAQPGVERVTLSVASPMAQFRVNNGIVSAKVQKEDLVDGNLKTADEDYINLFHLQLIAGRNLPDVKNPNEVVINRKLAKVLGHENPEDAIGDKFNYAGDMDVTVIGVIEDFHSVSFHQGMENVILANLPWNIKEMAIKINTGSGNFSDVQSTINHIKSEWDKLYPETIFDYSFLDQTIARMYENERKTSNLFQIFSAVAIFIGCLGLYGLVSYMANQKTKEIGIRKVMGASTGSIFGIFSKEMIILVIVAFLLAAPVAWYVMNNWLQGFQYQVPLSPMFFAAALLMSLSIALITIGYKAIAASSANPVNSLRSE
jgi:putative ABC transport system permease protein